jgi:hypothetical protein
LNNSDFFNLVVIDIFHRCSTSFPIEADFTVEEVAIAVSGYFDQESDIDMPRLFDVIWSSVDWLVREGFLTDRGISNSGFVVTFTNMGLNATNNVPSSISGKKSFKEIFVGGLATVSTGTASSIIAEFFKNGS